MGEFLAVVPNERMVFSFGWDEPGHPTPAGSTEVENTLVLEGEKTRVRLAPRGQPDDAVADHVKGWDFHLHRLSVAATGGNEGPDSAAG